MKILGRESAIARISTRSFSGRLRYRVGAQEQMVFEVAEGVDRFVVTSLQVEKG